MPGNFYEVFNHRACHTETRGAVDLGGREWTRTKGKIGKKGGRDGRTGTLETGRITGDESSPANIRKSSLVLCIN